MIFKISCSHYLAKLSACLFLIVGGKVFNKLLGYGRAALIGRIEMQKHIRKRRCCTLPVDAIVRIEALILNSDKSVYKVLRNARIPFRLIPGGVGVIFDPNTVILAVKPLILDEFARRAVFNIYSRRKVDFKIVKILTHCTVDHCKGIKNKRAYNDGHDDNTDKKCRKQDFDNPLFCCLFTVFLIRLILF